MYKRDILDYELLSYKVIQALRGDRTQNEMSKLLGFSYNQYAKYESGQKIFRVSEFFNALEVLELDFSRFLKDFLGVEYKRGVREENFSKVLTKNIIEHLLPLSETKIMSLLEVSKSRAWRLKNGSSELTFHEFLKLIDLEADSLFSFLSLFFSAEEIHGIGVPESKSYDLFDLYQKYPQSFYILCMCYLDSVVELPLSDQREKLKSLTKLDDDLFEELFDFLLDNDFLISNGSHYEANSFKYEIGDGDRSKKVKNQIWFIVLQKYIEKFSKNPIPDDLNKGNFKVAPMSEGGIKKVNDILTKTYQEITKVIDEDLKEPKKELLYFGQFFFKHR